MEAAVALLLRIICFTGTLYATGGIGDNQLLSSSPLISTGSSRVFA